MSLSEINKTLNDFLHARVLPMWLENLLYYGSAIFFVVAMVMALRSK